MKGFGSLLLLALVVFLGGCTGRELEERTFPSILAIESDDFEDIFIEKQEEAFKYLDYSHTKAVLFETDFSQNIKGLEQMILAMDENPEFAGNTLIFFGDDDALDLAEDKNGTLGNELQEYYKNHDREEESVTLIDLVNFFHNQEADLRIPVVKIQRGSLIPYGSLHIQQETGNA